MGIIWAVKENRAILSALQEVWFYIHLSTLVYKAEWKGLRSSLPKSNDVNCLKSLYWCAHTYGHSTSFDSSNSNKFDPSGEFWLVYSWCGTLVACYGVNTKSILIVSSSLLFQYLVTKLVKTIDAKFPKKVLHEKSNLLFLLFWNEENWLNPKSLAIAETKVNSKVLN